jgi:UDP-N-acetylmuramate dehydrogenase
MKIQENIALAPYTTLQVGGNARFFAEPANEEEIVEALRWARARDLPVFVLGGGSNLLVSDTGYDGLVLHVTLGGIEVANSGGTGAYSVGAGVNWDAFVARAVADGCAGVECLSGIPGSVGGTPVQNVGAYGQDVSESIVRVGGIDACTLEPFDISGEECGFSYRRSRFNTCSDGLTSSRFIITRVEFALRPGGEPKLAYAELQRRFSASPGPTLEQTRDAVLEIRRAKGMVLDENDADSRSAGSFFKNPVVSRDEYERIAAASDKPLFHFEAGEGQLKIAAAWLIEQSGINKGFALGRAAISGKHTLALVNRGGATAGDIVRLKELVQQRVRERFGIELQPEPVMLGF